MDPMMAAIRPTRSRGHDATRWVFTPLALSLLAHLVIVHLVGSIRIFDVEEFSSSISRWFHVVDIPEPLPVPPTVAVPGADEERGIPVPMKPDHIPLFEPKQRAPGPSFPDEKPLAVPAHVPTPFRPPDTEHSIIHRRGPAKVEQTNAAIGEIAPVHTVPVADVAPAGAGGRGVLRGSPGAPSPPPLQLELREAVAPRPATDAAPLAPPTVNPSATAVAPGAIAPQGIAIPIEDSLARRGAATAPVIIFPTTPTEPDEWPAQPFGDEVKITMDLFARPGEDAQYFRLQIAVAKPGKLLVIPKDVVFICDVSLSIERAEIVAARDALGTYLRTLRPNDRFNVILFSEEPRKLFPDFADPTPERIQAAVAFVDRLPGQTRTDVYRVLDAVVRDVAAQAVRNRPTNIFFLSDGRSTLGIRDARRIVNDISAYARPTFAILPFDAGSGGNRYLLDLLAYRSRGQAAFADTVEGAEKALESLFRTFDKPVLMQLKLTYTNLDVQETYPAFLPNLYEDQPIVLYGRCKPGQNVAINLEGRTPYSRRALVFSHTPGRPDPARDDIAREWARRKIHHIVSDIARIGESPDLKAEIERIGREYNVRTPYAR